MMPISRLTRSAPEPWMQERLERWCREWDIERALAAIPPTPAGGTPMPPEPASPQTSTCAPPPPLARAAADLIRPAAWLQPGSVALLVPGPRDTPEAPPFYAALLDAPKGPGCLLIPFSRFSEPATPGECFSTLDAPALRVLCLWNGRLLPGDDPLRGWQLCRLAPSAQERLHRLWQSYTATGRLPPDHARESGPPLSHPDDPRRLYLREARLQADAALHSARTPTLRHYECPDASPEALPRAAEPPPPDYTTD